MLVQSLPDLLGAVGGLAHEIIRSVMEFKSRSKMDCFGMWAKFYHIGLHNIYLYRFNIRIITLLLGDGRVSRLSP